MYSTYKIAYTVLVCIVYILIYQYIDIVYKIIYQLLSAFGHCFLPLKNNLLNSLVKQNQTLQFYQGASFDPWKLVCEKLFA